MEKTLKMTYKNGYKCIRFKSEGISSDDDVPNDLDV